MITAEKIEYIQSMVKSDMDSLMNNKEEVVTIWDNDNEKISYDVKGFQKRYIEITMKDSGKFIDTELVKVNV